MAGVVRFMFSPLQAISLDLQLVAMPKIYDSIIRTFIVEVAIGGSSKFISSIYFLLQSSSFKLTINNNDPITARYIKRAFSLYTLIIFPQEIR